MSVPNYVVMTTEFSWMSTNGSLKQAKRDARLMAMEYPGETFLVLKTMYAYNAEEDIVERKVGEENDRG